MTDPVAIDFRSLGLDEAMLAALDEVGYEAPSPIQAATIPSLLAGRDVLGQASTGTGKTGAFALPIIQRLDLERRVPQALVLTPTRELAIQVAEAFQRYACKRPGFHVLPVYGGQPYPAQVRPLERGVHVVVGTPGRIMDHMRRGTLGLGSLTTLVLDEADEMLAMGFLEDVTWILEQTPGTHQTALFSATMPAPVRRIAERHLRDPETIRTEEGSRTATTIRQRHQVVRWDEKLDALTRLLEVEPVEGMLIFVRTKTATVELSEKLEARGYATAPLNGDIAQALRERTVERFREGKLDLLVATDVAARGLDVERISHVLNYDIPNGTEAYVHRIGRTGRAGRTGEAILFVTPRERKMLHNLERNIGQPIAGMSSPTTREVNERRIARFKARLDAVREAEDTSFYEGLLADYVQESGATAFQAAAALAVMVQGGQPLLMVEPPRGKAPEREPGTGANRGASREFRLRERATPRAGERAGGHEPSASGAPYAGSSPKARGGADKKDGRHVEKRPDPGQERFRVEVGRQHGVQPGQLVAAIAGETGLDGKLIGRIDIRDTFSYVDLPLGIPKELFKSLKRALVCKQRLKITREGELPPAD